MKGYICKMGGKFMKKVILIAILALSVISFLVSCRIKDSTVILAKEFEAKNLSEGQTNLDLSSRSDVADASGNSRNESSESEKSQNGFPDHVVLMEHVVYSTCFIGDYYNQPAMGEVRLDSLGGYYQFGIGNPEYADATLAIEFNPIVKFRDGKEEEIVSITHSEELDRFLTLLDENGIAYLKIQKNGGGDCGYFAYMDAYTIDKLTEAIKDTDFGVSLRGAPEILMTEGYEAYAASER